jgi:hypothetical protein
MSSPHPEPVAFTDVQFLTAGVDEVELAKRVLLVQMAVALDSFLAIAARLQDGDAVELALAGFGVRFRFSLCAMARVNLFPSPP